MQSKLIFSLEDYLCLKFFGDADNYSYYGMEA
jgi:hypothetical protein